MSERIVITSKEQTLRRRGSIIDRFGVGWVPEGEEGRQVLQGPMVPGPWAYVFGLCSVIDNNGGSGRESLERLESGQEFMFEYGDTLVIDGVEYMTERAPNDNVALTPLA